MDVNTELVNIDLWIRCHGQAGFQCVATNMTHFMLCHRVISRKSAGCFCICQIKLLGKTKFFNDHNLLNFKWNNVGNSQISFKYQSFVKCTSKKYSSAWNYTVCIRYEFSVVQILDRNSKLCCMWETWIFLQLFPNMLAQLGSVWLFISFSVYLTDEPTEHFSDLHAVVIVVKNFITVV